jgi:hypothetical protein
MRSFKVDGRIFIGFDQNFETEHDLLLVQNEDSIEAYAFDKGMDERILIMDDFLRMLDMIESQAKIIGFYGEQGFRGVKFCDNSLVWPKSRFKQ